MRYAFHARAMQRHATSSIAECCIDKYAAATHASARMPFCSTPLMRAVRRRRLNIQPQTYNRCAARYNMRPYSAPRAHASTRRYHCRSICGYNAHAPRAERYYAINEAATASVRCVDTRAIGSMLPKKKSLYAIRHMPAI